MGSGSAEPQSSLATTLPEISGVAFTVICAHLANYARERKITSFVIGLWPSLGQLDDGRDVG